MKSEHQTEQLISRYPALQSIKTDLLKSFDMLCNCFENGGKLMVCGNGGSASDANHLVAELMKSFTLERPLDKTQQKKLTAVHNEKGKILARKLNKALPAISLTANNALITAIANDINATMVFAQQITGMGNSGDVLFCISTSGNSENIINALITAKALEVKTIGLTGQGGGEMLDYCDVAIRVDEKNTHLIQELHLPVYHTLCTMLEEKFFGE